MKQDKKQKTFPRLQNSQTKESNAKQKKQKETKRNKGLRKIADETG